MYRRTKLVLAVLTAMPLVAGTLPPPAAMAATEEVVRVVPNGPGKAFQIITRNSERIELGQYNRYLAETSYEVSWDQFAQANQQIVQYVAAREATSGGFHEPRISGNFLSTLSQVLTVDGVRLLTRQLADIYAVIHQEGIASEMENLRDPAKRFAFWKEQGIYDKYTPQEIAFMNTVTFNVAAVGGVGELLVGAALSAVGGGMALGPAGQIILGVGTLMVAGGTLLEMLNDIHSGKPVDPNFLADYLLGAVATKLEAVFGATGVTSWTAKTVIMKLLGATMTAAEKEVLLATGVLGSLTTAFAGTGVATHAAVFIGKLANIWGVPVPAGTVPGIPGLMIKPPEPPYPETRESQWEIKVYLSN